MCSNAGSGLVSLSRSIGSKEIFNLRELQRFGFRSRELPRPFRSPLIDFIYNLRRTRVVSSLNAVYKFPEAARFGFADTTICGAFNIGLCRGSGIGLPAAATRAT